VIIAVKTDQMKETFFLNIKAQSNVISQHFIVVSEIIKLNTEISQFLLLNDHFSYCYDAYFVQYYFKDDWEQKCDCEHVFYVMNKNESELVLSLFTLKKKNIHINCKLMIWHFKINLWMFILKDAESFEKTTNKSVICILLWSVLKVKTVCIQNANITSVFFLSMQNIRMSSLKLKWDICLFMRSMIMSLTLIMRTFHTNFYTICQTKNCKSYETIWTTF